MSQKNASTIFTRYLYNKEEVEIALTTCILEKKNDAIFWAYELFYSGYQTETFIILWKIYYYFFSTLNPSFEVYFMKTQKEWSKTKTDDCIISVIVNNLLIRSFNLDVFLLHKVNTHLEIEEDEEVKPTFNTLLETRKYLTISKHLLESEITLLLLNTIANHFIIDTDKSMLHVKNWNKIIKFHNDTKITAILIISKVIGFYSKQEKMTSVKNFYITIEPNEIDRYKTINSSKIHPYKVLPIVCEFSIDAYNYLSLFDIIRHNDPKPMDKYHYKWLYYASQSPIWADRIQHFNGSINHASKLVEFSNEDDNDLFYDTYGYEPDEQRIEIQHRNIQPITQTKSWRSMIEEHLIHGLVKIDEDILEAFERIRLFE